MGKIDFGKKAPKRKTKLVCKRNGTFFFFSFFEAFFFCMWLLCAILNRYNLGKQVGPKTLEILGLIYSWRVFRNSFTTQKKKIYIKGKKVQHEVDRFITAAKS